MKKLLLFALAILLISCAEESKEDEESSSNSSTEIKVSVSSVNISSNIGSIDYLVKTNSSSSSSNSLISNSLSSDSSSGFVYGFTSGDSIKPIFTPFDAGYATDIKKKDGNFIFNGSFNVSSTSNNVSTIECLIIFQSGDSSNCILEKQTGISSANASFYKDGALLMIAQTGNDEKLVYEYDLGSTFTQIVSFKDNAGCDVRSDCFSSGSSSSYSVNGEVSKSYNTEDTVSFLIEGTSKEVALFQKVGTEYRIKKDSMTSTSVVNIDGYPFYMSEEYLRDGWNRRLYYNQSNNNRTVSNENLLISKKDAYFTFFYQENYVEHGHSMSAIFYLKDRRKDLPTNYPQFTLERINCCVSKNAPSGIRTNVGELSWKKVSGFNKYAIAYGEAASGYDGKSGTDIAIDKAIILINGDDKVFDTNSNPVMKPIYLYDHNNTSSQEDNLINPLSFDVVTNIENYKNGFKLTGTKYSNERVIFFNPVTRNIETPNTDDQTTFTISERI